VEEYLISKSKKSGTAAPQGTSQRLLDGWFSSFLGCCFRDICCCVAVRFPLRCDDQRVKSFWFLCDFLLINWRCYSPEFYSLQMSHRNYTTKVVTPLHGASFLFRVFGSMDRRWSIFMSETPVPCAAESWCRPRDPIATE
jgi:hypothetical protein